MHIRYAVGMMLEIKRVILVHMVDWDAGGWEPVGGVNEMSILFVLALSFNVRGTRIVKYWDFSAVGALSLSLSIASRNTGHPQC